MSRFAKAIAFGFVGLAGLSAAGCVSSPATAQYYETQPRYYDEDDVYVPRRRGYQQPGYYQQQPGYYQQPQQRGYYQEQPRGRYQQPQYYDKDAAKDYWRAQKEAQKNAIKRGYVQPQQYAPQPQYAPQQRAAPGLSYGGGSFVAPFDRPSGTSDVRPNSGP
jgi:hypothetical protein